MSDGEREEVVGKRTSFANEGSAGKKMGDDTIGKCHRPLLEVQLRAGSAGVLVNLD